MLPTKRLGITILAFKFKVSASRRGDALCYALCFASLQKTRFASLRRQKTRDAKQSKSTKNPRRFATPTKNPRREAEQIYNELDKTDFQAKVEANKNFISHFTFHANVSLRETLA